MTEVIPARVRVECSCCFRDISNEVFKSLSVQGSVARGERICQESYSPAIEVCERCYRRIDELIKSMTAK